VRVCTNDGSGTACQGEPGPPNTGDACLEGVDDDCDGEIDEPDDCVGLAGAGPDAGEVVTGADVVDNFNCDTSDSGGAPWLLGLLLSLGLRRRRRGGGVEA
jgi:MYXO-CTERM domain-containing protein